MTNNAAVMRERPPRKRRRLVISCTECHRRKQKCDRDLPCANCRSRNKESSCTYETTARGPTKSPAKERSQDPAETQPGDDSGPSMSSVAAALGYSQTGASTMGFLRRIETQDDGGSSGVSVPDAGAPPTASTTRDAEAVKERFRCLIRQLPARTYLDRLIAIFLSTFNYQYYPVEPDVFRAQLEQWHALPFKLLTSRGPDGLDPDMRVFPAVLFQVVATALLVVKDNDNNTQGGLAAELGALKYAAGMTFEDLAVDYSESGMAIVGLFDKRSLAVTTVQAEFLRAAFLKYTARVTDSWHMISVAIKDAQELGMHRDSLDPKPVDSSAEAALENEWLIQRRRRLYMVLTTWDINTSIFLGRPGTINRSHGLPTPPVDTAMPRDRSRTPVVARDQWKDPPTPLAGILWLRELDAALFDIQDLEQEGPHPRDLTKIDQVHRRIMDIEARKPAIFRVDNPDTRWDDQPETSWVPVVRYHFASLNAFSRMVLHRPYIFHREQSRDEALRASLETLEMAGRMFEGLAPDHWRNYHLFYGSFDALVVLSTIYIVFPREHAELKQSALRQFHWTMERFSVMQERNPLAKSAQGVLRAILVKLTRAMNSTSTSTSMAELPAVATAAVPSSGTPASTRGTTTDSTAPASLSSFEDQQGAHTLLTGNGGGGAAHAPAAFMAAGTDWSMPSMDALASLAPMYPTSDLLFNDLSVVGDGIEMPPLDDYLTAAAAGENYGQATMPSYFGGGFGEDTVWQLLNQYEPGGQHGASG